QGRRALDVEPLRIGGCADAGRQGVAGKERHVCDRTALRAPFGPKRALRIDIALIITIVTRIGIDDAADRAVLGRDLRLDVAPRAAVTRDDDLAFNINAALREF